MSLLPYADVTPAELRERLDRGDALRVVDVREPIELDMARIEGFEHIPLADLPARAAELDAESEIVLVCHHGVRSAYACRYLASLGFTRLHNLVGGIDLWSLDVDPSVPRY